MGRNFHNLHVYADTKDLQARVRRAVLAYAKQGGYVAQKTARNADRVIRLGGKAPWLTIEDDGYEIGGIADAIAKAVKTPILEAYCEASARVGLGLRSGRSVGGWGWGFEKAPAKKLVESILIEGTAAEFETAWEEGARQVFPESALAVAAKRFGVDVATMFGDKALRGATLAFRKKTKKWTPKFQKGAPSFDVGWGSNQGWGHKHLVFEGELEDHRVHVKSTGGPGKGFSIRFGGSAIETGAIEIVNVSHERLKLVRDGDTWRDPKAKIPAGLVDEPDIWQMSRSEKDKADKVTDKLDWYIDVQYRALRDSDVTLVSYVESGGHVGDGALDLHINWRPWRPSTTREQVDDHDLFQYHRRDQSVAHFALRGSLTEAWSWAGPHIEAWATRNKDECLWIRRDGDVVLEAREPPIPWDRVVEFIPTDARTTFDLQGASFRFGTFAYAPYKMDERDKLVVQLVLHARNANDDGTANVAALSAIADAATPSNIAYSAVVAEQQYSEEKSGWEGITVRDDGPLKVAAWHETHIRGLSKNMWMSAAHAALVDRNALAKHGDVTDLGNGIRITIDRAKPRADLEPLVAILAPVLPSQAEIERFLATR